MISAVVLTKNEEDNIRDCLQGLSWCDEIIIIDDNSTDRTIKIAEKANANIYVHPLRGDFSQQRNYGLDKAKGDWVLFVDADERVTPALWYEVMQHTNSSIDSSDGFFIRRVDFMWGRKLMHGETGNIKLLRLAKKNAGKWDGTVHEQWKINGKTITLKNELMHYPHPDVTSFLKEINYYTELRARELHNKKVGVLLPAIILYPVSKFIVNYIIKLGFLDGIPGLISAFMMSFHSFLVRGKLWSLSLKKEQKNENS